MVTNVPVTRVGGGSAERAFGCRILEWRGKAPRKGGVLGIGRRLAALCAAAFALSGCVQSRPLGIAACGPYYYGYDATTHAVGNRPLGGGVSTPDLSAVIAGNKVQHSFIVSNRGFSSSEDEITRLIQAIGTIGQEAKAGSHPPRLNILALSGGGQWGAYGAGLLTGWSQRDAKLPNGVDPYPDAPRLRDIDIVTGISTGAVLLSLAVPATDDPASPWPADALAQMAKDYNDPNIADIAVERNLVLAALFHDSLYDNSGLEKRVYSTIDHFMPSLKGMPPTKRFYVGTTNADDLNFYVVDLKAMVDTLPAGPASGLSASPAGQCLSESVLSSSAIPILFPPRFVGSGMFMDGGTRAGLFASILLTEERVVKAMADAHLVPDVTVVINGNQNDNNITTGSPETANGLKDIALAAEGSLVDQTYKDSVFRTEMDLLVAYGSKYATRYTYIPNSLITAASAPSSCKNAANESENVFDHEFMTCLFQIGLGRWTSADGPWQPFSEIPRISPPQAPLSQQPAAATH